MAERKHSSIKKKFENGIEDIAGLKKLSTGNKSRYLSGKKVRYEKMQKGLSVDVLVDKYFQAYNSARLAEACRVFVNKCLEDDVTIGMSLTGALTPAGLGSAVIPLIENGFVDWIVSTGANMYHDTHFALGHSLFRGSPFMDDIKLRKEWVIRIYDVLFDADVLYHTDAFYRKLIMLPEFQKKISTSEFHYRVGKYLHMIEKNVGAESGSVLSAAYRCGVPIYTSSPGDSSIGMNVAAVELEGSRMQFDVNRDVNETAAIVLNAKKRGNKGKPGKSAVLIFGGGSPKNFMLQTEPQIQEVLGIQEKGHDYFLQFTDARPDTGGLSGATPSEAVSWGKVDPEMLPDTIVCYTDTTIAMPILTSYALNKHKPRKLKRLAENRDELMEFLIKQYRISNK